MGCSSSHAKPIAIAGDSKEDTQFPQVSDEKIKKSEHNLAKLLHEKMNKREWDLEKNVELCPLVDTNHSEKQLFASDIERSIHLWVKHFTEIEEDPKKRLDNA